MVSFKRNQCLKKIKIFFYRVLTALQKQCLKCEKLVRFCVCAQNQQVFNSLKDNFNYKRCPECRHAIQKISGCNILSCLCGYQFCQICSEKVGHNEHICRISIDPPRDMVNVDMESQSNLACKRFFKKYIISIPIYIFITLTLLLAITAICIFLALSYTLLGIVHFPKTFCKQFNNFKPFMQIVILIFLPISVLVSIIYNICQFIKCQKQQNDMKKQCYGSPRL